MCLGRNSDTHGAWSVVALSTSFHCSLAAAWSVALVVIALAVIAWIVGSQNSERLALAVLFARNPLQPTTMLKKLAADG
jgi:hypothetical protein